MNADDKLNVSLDGNSLAICIDLNNKCNPFRARNL